MQVGEDWLALPTHRRNFPNHCCWIHCCSLCNMCTFPLNAFDLTMYKAQVHGRWVIWLYLPCPIRCWNTIALLDKGFAFILQYPSVRGYSLSLGFRMSWELEVRWAQLSSVKPSEQRHCSPAADSRSSVNCRITCCWKSQKELCLF